MLLFRISNKEKCCLLKSKFLVRIFIRSVFFAAMIKNELKVTSTSSKSGLERSLTFLLRGKDRNFLCSKSGKNIFVHVLDLLDSLFSEKRIHPVFVYPQTLNKIQIRRQRFG